MLNVTDGTATVEIIDRRRCEVPRAAGR